MGPVASILIMAIFASAAFFAVQAWSHDTSDGAIEVWVTRVVSTLLVLILGTALIDEYVVDVPMPFAPREADLPARGVAPPVTPALDLKPAAKPASTAESDQQTELRAWEARGGR